MEVWKNILLLWVREWVNELEQICLRFLRFPSVSPTPFSCRFLSLSSSSSLSTSLLLLLLLLLLFFIFMPYALQFSFRLPTQSTHTHTLSLSYLITFDRNSCRHIVLARIFMSARIVGGSCTNASGELNIHLVVSICVYVPVPVPESLFSLYVSFSSRLYVYPECTCACRRAYHMRVCVPSRMVNL